MALSLCTGKFVSLHFEICSRAGMSRSASVVIAYLIREKGFDYFSGLGHVKDKRSIVRPAYGKEVIEYEKICIKNTEIADL